MDTYGEIRQDTVEELVESACRASRSPTVATAPAGGGLEVHHRGRVEVHTQVQDSAWSVDLVSRVWVTRTGGFRAVASVDLPFGEDDRDTVARAVEVVVARAALVVRQGDLHQRVTLERLVAALADVAARHAASRDVSPPSGLPALVRVAAGRGLTRDELVALVLDAATTRNIWRPETWAPWWSGDLVDRALSDSAADAGEDSEAVQDVLDAPAAPVEGLQVATARLAELRDLAAAALADRDRAVRRARKALVPVAVVEEVTGLSRPRVNQIVKQGKQATTKGQR